MTPRALITLALKLTGVTGQGQTPSSEDINDAFTLVNSMLGQWKRKRWLIFHLIDVSHQATGQVSYTIGSGGEIDTERPDRVEAGFFRQTVPSQPSQVDFPMEVLQAREDYNRISLKTLSTFPRYLFYDAAYPLGVIYPWPVPSDLYAIHLSVKAELQAFANLSTEIALPPEYEEALYWNLAARLRPMYQLPPDPTVTAMAENALNVIRNANAQVPRLTMPAGLPGRRGSGYNIFSDDSGWGG